MTEIWKVRKDSDGPSITNSESGEWIGVETTAGAEFLAKELNRLMEVAKAATALVVFTPADFPTHTNLRKALEDLNDD